MEWQQVRQDKSDGFYVEGLTHAAAADERAAMGLMSRALAWRHTRSHKLNAYSSRSHCLMSFAVASQQLGGQQQGANGEEQRPNTHRCESLTRWKSGRRVD